MTFSGWVWEGGCWHRRCTGESVGAVARLMNVLVKDTPTHRQCITGGAAPTFQAREGDSRGPGARREKDPPTSGL
jgi:hypothetical protein